MQSLRTWRVPQIIAVVLIFAASWNRSAAQATPQEDIPIHSIPQNLPCADQPKSLKELIDAFNGGRLPSPTDMTGTWVAISTFIDTYETTINCSGLKRGTKVFEEVMIATGYMIELHAIGAAVQRPAVKLDSTNSLSFPFDFGGDANPVFRCRLTTRKTLACLIDVYRQGIEFKRIPAKPDEMAAIRPSNTSSNKLESQ